MRACLATCMLAPGSCASAAMACATASRQPRPHVQLCTADYHLTAPAPPHGLCTTPVAAEAPAPRPTHPPRLPPPQITIGSASFEIPSASMSLFNTLSIIVLIPVYDKLLEPGLRKAGKRMTLLQRIGWGMAVAVLAMATAGLVEYYRLRDVHTTNANGSGTGSETAPQPTPASLSILWQGPQYLLVGLSEVLASIGQLELFYDQAPDVMRSCSMALQLLSTALGSYLSGAVLLAVQRGTNWLPRDLNAGRMDLFFYSLAVVMVANLVIYIWVALKYEYKAVEHRLGQLKAPTVEDLAPGIGGPGQAGLPSQPFQQRASAAVGIGGRRGGRVGQVVEDQVDVYGRSLAFLPQSPALPAPFR
jgi:peptide/histidine transporter 3/4